jgi:cell division transport system permease protein
MRTSGGLGDVLDSLPRNPFPDAYIVIPRDQSPEEMEHLRAEFAKYPKVEHVQLDSSWVKKLHSLLGLVRLALGFLAGLLGVALVAVTFNAIRLQVLTQDAEIELSRLLGATDAFVRRPFYYFGALQGLAGGLVAWVIVLAGALLLQQPVGELAGLYGLSISLQGLPLSDSLALLGFATLLGWLGAWLSLNSHLGSRSEF